MSAGTIQDPRAELRRRLAAVRRRWRASVALSGAARAAALAAIPVLVFAALYWIARPQGVLWAAAASAAAALALAAVPLVRLRQTPDDRRVARFVEERADGEPADTIASAVDLADHPDAAAQSGFAPLVMRRALDVLRRVPPEHVIAPAVLRRAGAQALAGAAILAVALIAAWPGISHALLAARLQLFPGSVQVEVTPGNVRVLAGTPVRITATLREREGVIEKLVPSMTVSAAGEQRTVPMQATPQGFEVAIESVDRSFTYRVTAGAARSEEYTVTALFAPRVERIDVEYVYPPFTGLAPRVEEDGGDIYGPAGTRVRVRVHTDKPVTRGELAPAGAKVSALRLRGERVLEGDLVLAKDDSYRIRLSDADGLGSAGDTEYFIRLMNDRPPDVRILRPSADQQITPLEEVAIEARADDDYGIGQFDLVYAVAGGKERVVPFDRVSGTAIEKVGSRLIAAEDLRVKPGDVITYYARARDVPRGKRSTETRSDIFFLEVKPFSEEFVAAESQASAGGGGGAELEAVIAAQKEIITATWNIERRAAAGRSADDVAAIARAQAELKARVERMSGGGSGRSRRGVRPPAPQRVGAGVAQGPGGSDPIAAAAEAMARAVQQLEGQKTRDAIAHEMAALNGLLRAQAASRRRQVTQGSSGSGSGGNRSSQDLSALFDKELQRQQRTNYENRPSIENKAEKPENHDAAADRVRDLARRQEDLSRRQRELADAGLSAEELKRQLEKLTREQMELRQQAEDLARSQQRQQAGQSQQQPGQPGQRGQQGGQPGASGHEMERAAEEMRSAASELRRDNAQGAAESSQRATDELRRLEEKMRGNRQGEGQRGRDDLRVEAQQAAQEQRRIAGEASRLENTTGSGAEEARRRLAEEKDRLAGRVEELQRAAERSAKTGKGAEASAAAETSRELEKQRVAERMRESARGMRAGQQPSAAREGEIARALDKAVDKLGGSAESTRLAGQLEQTREIRDRLNRLEQQMRQAEQKGKGQGQGQQGDELDKLRRQYQRELARARDALAQLGKGEQRTGTGMATPEQEEFSRSAPGTEAFKQDRSGWETLRRDIDLSLERYEASLSEKLQRTAAADRLHAGGSDRVPDGYRAWIARYYQSLAKVKK